MNDNRSFFDMTLPFQPPTKEVDVEFLVFMERYATDLLKWDILAYFAQYPYACVSAAKIAQAIGCSSHSIRPELGDLTLLKVLEHASSTNGQVLYQLTPAPTLRRVISKFANQFSLDPA
jgi:hypothetical protein